MGDVYKSKSKLHGKRIVSAKWYGSWLDESGRRVNRALSVDKTTARRILAKRSNDALLIREGLLPRAATHRDAELSDLVAEWLSSLTPVQQVARSKHISVFVETWRKANEIDAAEATRIAAGLDVSDHTRHKYLSGLKQFVRWCVRNSRIAFDPLLGLKLPRFAKAPRRCLTADEVSRLLNTRERRWRKLSCFDRRVLYAVALGTGFRAGEIASLTAASFDGESLTLPGTATKNRKPCVQPLPTWLIEVLRDYIRGVRGPLFPGRWRTQPYRMVRHDGVDACFHELRHTYITSLIRAGLNPKDVQHLARHSTITLTFDCYGHVSDNLSHTVRTLPAP